jgi:hypothetical protein
MKAIKKILVVYLIITSIQGCVSDNGKSNKVFTEIINEFDTHQLVAIGESHGWKEESEFIFEMIKEPFFSKQVNDIVVECGNSKYQSLMDDYVNGKDIPIAELQQVWRNMTVLCTCDAPIYEQLFETVRAVNQKADSNHRLRVLLGEPPIDWKKISKSEELGAWVFQRDEYYAGVVEKEILQKNRKGLLIMGSLHFIKKGWGEEPQTVNKAPMTFNNADTNKKPAGTFMMPIPDSSKKELRKSDTKEIVKIDNAATNSPAPNVSQILEQKYPGKLFIILPYDGYGDSSVNKEIEEKFGNSEKPTVVNTQSNWIGKLDAGLLFTRKSLALTNGKVTGEVNYNPYPNFKISDLCDAYLYISGRENMTRSIPAYIFSDTAYLKELNRRSIIISGNPFNVNNYTETSLKLHE